MWRMNIWIIDSVSLCCSIVQSWLTEYKKMFKNEWINAWISHSRNQSRDSCCLRLKLWQHICLQVFLSVNKGDTVCLAGSSSCVMKKPPLCCFVTILPVGCLFLRLTTNLLAQAICKNGSYFAWQGIRLELNNGSSCEIWQQGLTFGSLCLLPRLIYVSRLCSVPHQEEVLQETQI